MANVTAKEALSLVAIDDLMRSQVDPLVAARAGPPTSARASRGLIIMLFSNSGFTPFLKNLICGMDRVGVHNYLAMGFDNRTCPLLTGDIGLRGGQEASCVFPYAHRPLTTSGIAKYRSLEFNRMVMQRPLWILHLLQHGFETLQVDLDVTWIADPQPLFATARYASHDLLFQSEGGHGFNAGFYLARPNGAAIHVLEAWVHDLARQAGSKAFEEQHSLGRSIAHRNRSVPLLVEKLKESQFPNGKIWWQYGLPANKSTAYVVHCNWVKGNKKGRLVRDNLWSLDQADSRCAAEWNPLAGGCSRHCRPVRYCQAGHRCPQEPCKKMMTDKVWHSMAFREAGCINHTSTSRKWNHTYPSHGHKWNHTSAASTSALHGHNWQVRRGDATETYHNWQVRRGDATETYMATPKSALVVRLEAIEEAREIVSV